MKFVKTTCYDMRDYFDCLKWQIVKSIIDILIFYLFTKYNKKINYPIFHLHIYNFIR